MSKFKEKLLWNLAYLIPESVMLYAIIRAFSRASTTNCAHKHPDDIGYSDVYKAWEPKES